MTRVRSLLRSKTAGDLALIFSLAAALRLLLLFLFPVPYGHDGFGRLFFKDHVFLGHWLPLTQLIVWASHRCLGDLFLVRLVFALLTSLSGWGFYFFLRLLVDRRLAMIGGLLFSFDALFLFLSLMPYQDVLFLGLLFGALAFLSRGEGKVSLSASLLLGLACLTRYESWFLLPVLFFSGLSRISSGPHTHLLFPVVRSLLLLGWAPLVWLSLSRFYWGSFEGFLRQTADGRPYAWNPHFDIGWVLHYSGKMFYWTGLFGSPVVFLAPLGLWILCDRRRGVHPALQLPLVLMVLVLAFFFFIIGRGQETVFRFVLIPLALALVLATPALGHVLAALERRGIGRTPAVIVLLAGLCLYGSIPILRVTAQPDYIDPFLISRELNARLDEGERALVIAARTPELTDSGPLAYQRIAVQVGGDRILSSGLLGLRDPERLLEWAASRRIRYLVHFRGNYLQTAADKLFLSLADPQQGFVHRVYATPTAEVFEIEDWPRFAEIVEMLE